MLLDICKEHRKRYGWLIRQKRIALGYTQKELVETLGHAVSLRSYIALETEKRCRIWISMISCLPCLICSIIMHAIPIPC